MSAVYVLQQFCSPRPGLETTVAWWCKRAIATRVIDNRMFCFSYAKEKEAYMSRGMDIWNEGRRINGRVYRAVIGM